MDDLPPPPAYEYTQQELDVKLSHAFERSLALTDPSRADPDGYEIWNDDAHHRAAQQMRHYASQRPQSSSSSYRPPPQPQQQPSYRDEKRNPLPTSPPLQSPAAPAYSAAGSSRNSAIGFPSSSSSSSSSSAQPVPAYVPSGAYRQGQDEKRGFPADPISPASPAAPAYSATPAYSPPPPPPSASVPVPGSATPVRPLNIAKKSSPGSSAPSQPHHHYSHLQQSHPQQATQSRPLPQYQAQSRSAPPPAPYTQHGAQPYQAKPPKQPIPEPKQRPNWLDPPSPPPPHSATINTHVPPPRPHSTGSSSSVNESPTDETAPPPFMSMSPPRSTHTPPQQRPLNVLAYNPQSHARPAPPQPQPQRRTPEPRSGAALYSSAMSSGRNGLIARAQSQQPILGSKLNFDHSVAYKSPFGSMPPEKHEEDPAAGGGSLYSSAMSGFTPNRFSVVPTRLAGRGGAVGMTGARSMPDRRRTGGFTAPTVPQDLPPLPNQFGSIQSPPPHQQSFTQQPLPAPPAPAGGAELHRRQSFYPPGAAPPIQPSLGHPASSLPDLPTSPPPPPPHPIPPPPPPAIPVRQDTYGGPLGGVPTTYQTPPPPPSAIPISPNNQTQFGFQSHQPAMPGFFAQPGPNMYASLQQESMQQSMGNFFPPGSGFR